jgi:hypothetical protein
MPTREEILAEAARRRAGPTPRSREQILAEAERRRATAGALPLPEVTQLAPEFARAPSDFEATALEADAAAKATAQRLEMDDGTALEAERKRLESARRSLETSLQTGAKPITEPTSFVAPLFRPTRIRELAPEEPRGAPGTPQGLSDRDLDQAILATGDEARLKELSAESDRRKKEAQAKLRSTPTPEVQALQVPPGPRPEGQRVYRDPRTGELRPPTAIEEVVEAYGRQPVLSEAAARDASERIKRAQDELERRIAKGEDVGLFEYAGPLFSGILSTREAPGAGTTETELGAFLRGGLGTLSALAAEGYFRGLGYEVDEAGLPTDPTDLGYVIKTWRDQVGIPDVVTSRQGFGIPLPGVATTSTQRKASTYDPEGRRRVSGIEVPSATEDPAGFVEAEARRLARSIAAGRTWADEFADSPATRKFYDRMWGDEDAAFWAGSLAEVAIPAGPGTAARSAMGGMRAATKTGAAGKVAGSLIEGAEAAREGSVARAVLNPFADVAAAVVPGRASDGRVVRRVAQKTIDTMLIDTDLAEAAKAAIKPTSSTPAQILDDVGDLLDPAYVSPWRGPVARGSGLEASLRAVQGGDLSPAVKHFYTALVRNVPDDLVLITNNVAVPRALAKEAQDIVAGARQRAAQRSTAEVLEALGRLPVDDPTIARAVERAQQIAGRSIGDFLSPSERRAIDALLPDQAITVRATEDLVKDLGEGRLATMLQAEPRSAQVLDLVTNELANRELVRQLPQRARFSRDLTDAQVFLRGSGSLLERAVGDSPEARRLRAVLRAPGFGAPRTETVASTITKRELQAAARGSIREVGQELSARAARLKSVDLAVDELAVERLSELPVDEAWIKALESIYGNPELARAVRANAEASGTAGLDRVPTVQALRAVDQLYARAGKFVGRSNVVDESFDLFGAPVKAMAALLMPDYQRAMLKVILEEGVRKSLAKGYKERDLLEAGVDVALDPTAGMAVGAARAAELLRETTRAPDFAKSAEIADFGKGTARIRVYDPIASAYEKALAETAEEFVQFAESQSPRQRLDLITAAKSAYEWALLGPGRNMATAAKYGYVLPNLPYLAGETLRPAVLSLVSSGLSRTTDALAQLPRVLSRRLVGGGLYTEDGRYFSPTQLAELGRTNGLGYSAVETERVGTLSYDVMKDAEKAARASGGAWSRAGAELAYELNPLTKVFGQRIAEAVEVSFRQAVFEARLASGDTIPEAAEAARRSALDYSEVPGPVRDWVGRYVADAAQRWQLIVELARLARENPAAARIYYKGVVAKSKLEDPYNVHGDQGLKSIGLISAGDKALYVPGLGRSMEPIGSVLGASRNSLAMVGALARAVEDTGMEGLVADVFEAGSRLGRDVLDEALPTMLRLVEAYDAQSATKYQSTGAPGALAMSDEGAFWATAVWAHHADPDRKSGAWKAFVDLYKPEFVAPPPSLAAYPSAKDQRRNYWKKAPPGGIPHLVWGVDRETGETVYKVLQPSEIGRLQMSLVRKLPGAQAVEQLGWYGAATLGALETPGAIGPVRAAPAIPALTSSPSSALQMLFAPAPTAAQARQSQAATLAEATASGSTR